MEKTFEVEVIERLAKIETKLSNGMVKKQDDHERRIRFLEKGLYIAIGGLALLQIILKIVFK